MSIWWTYGICIEKKHRNRRTDSTSKKNTDGHGLKNERLWPSLERISFRSHSRKFLPVHISSGHSELPHSWRQRRKWTKNTEMASAESSTILYGESSPLPKPRCCQLWEALGLKCGLVPLAQMAFLHQPETISGARSTTTVAWQSTSWLVISLGNCASNARCFKHRQKFDKNLQIANKVVWWQDSYCAKMQWFLKHVCIKSLWKKRFDRVVGGGINLFIGFAGIRRDL